MGDSIPRETFEQSYVAGTPPWVIGQPQPALVELERAGGVSGSVLDVGCGTGEHAILLAELGYEVLGLDSSETAVTTARRNASERGVPARFEVADAFDLGARPRFDTVVDSALLHVFGARDRLTYTRSLHAVCRPGAVLHVLALADIQDAGGPRLSAAAVRGSFGPGWELEELRQSRYRGIAGEQQAERPAVRPDEAVDTAAWLARARRV